MVGIACCPVTFGAVGADIPRGGITGSVFTIDGTSALSNTLGNADFPGENTLCTNEGDTPRNSREGKLIRWAEAFSPLTGAGFPAARLLAVPPAADPELVPTDRSGHQAPSVYSAIAPDADQNSAFGLRDNLHETDMVVDWSLGPGGNHLVTENGRSAAATTSFCAHAGACCRSAVGKSLCGPSLRSTSDLMAD